MYQSSRNVCVNVIPTGLHWGTHGRAGSLLVVRRVLLALHLRDIEHNLLHSDRALNSLCIRTANRSLEWRPLGVSSAAALASGGDGLLLPSELATRNSTPSTQFYCHMISELPLHSELATRNSTPSTQFYCHMISAQHTAIWRG
jgi:hypothetical protein